MNEQNILLLCFGIGVFTQAFIFIRNDWNWWKVIVSIICGLLIGITPILGCVMGGIPKGNSDFGIPVFMGLGIFSFLFAFLFRDDILPIVTEKILLSYSLTFFYVFFSYFYKGTNIHNILFFLFLIPSLATIFIAFIKMSLNFFWKIFFYSWFLFIIVFIGLLRFSYNHLSIFYDRHHISWIGPIDCILTGMAFLYLFANVIYIWELIPIPGKYQSWEDRMQDWYELTNLMTKRYDEQRPTHLQTILILVLQGGGLALNYQFYFLPAGMAINLLILLPVILSMGSSSTKVALQYSSEAMYKEI